MTVRKYECRVTRRVRHAHRRRGVSDTTTETKDSVRFEFRGGTLVLHASKDDADVPATFTWDAREGLHRARAVDYAGLILHLRAKGRPYEDAARAYAEVAFTPRAAREPFDHQREAIAAWRKAGGRGVVVLPATYFGPGQETHLRFAFANATADALARLPERLRGLAA